jgi:hypothetical protein
LAQIVGQVQESNRNFQSKYWAKSYNLGNPVKLTFAASVAFALSPSIVVILEREKVLGWPKICRLAHAFLWENCCKRLELAQLLGQLGVSLTSRPLPSPRPPPPPSAPAAPPAASTPASPPRPRLAARESVINF